MARETGRSWFRTEAAVCLFVACVLFHLFFKAHWAFLIGPQNDDGCYVATLNRFLFQSAEGLCDQRPNYFAPGAPLLWWPSGLAALLLSFVTGLRLYHWLQPMIAFTSFAFAGLALRFAYRTVRDEADRSGFGRPWFWTLAVFLNAPILYYASHWAIMPHTAQLMLAFATVHWIDRRRFVPAGVAAFLLCLVRFNDAPVVLLFLGALLDLRKERGGAVLPRGSPRHWAVAGLLAAAALGVGWIAFAGYGPVVFVDLLRETSWTHAEFFLLHDRWGMLWMSPWWIFALVLGAVFVARLSWLARGALGWILAEAAVATVWGGNGGDFGYRYLIGSYAGAWIVWRELARSGEPMRAAFRGLTVAGAAWMTYLTVAYRTIDALSPALVRTESGELVFGGLVRFQSTALAHAFDPEVYAAAIAQQIPLVTLWKSFALEGDPTAGDLVVEGPGQLLLALVALGSLFYMVAFVRRAIAARRLSGAGRPVPSGSSR